MDGNQFPRRYFFYGTLLAGAVPSGGFGSTPSLSALGYKSPNEKLNIGAVGIGIRGPAILVGAAATENIVALVRCRRSTLGPWIRSVSECQEVQRLPQDVRGRGQEHRRGDDRDARSHAHAGRAARHAAGQARLLRKAAHPDALGGATAGRRRAEVQSRDADGQSGLESRGHQNGLRDPLVRRYRRREGTPRLYRRHLRRPAEHSRHRTRERRPYLARSIGICGSVVPNRAPSIL